MGKIPRSWLLGFYDQWEDYNGVCLFYAELAYSYVDPKVRSLQMGAVFPSYRLMAAGN